MTPAAAERLVRALYPADRPIAIKRVSVLRTNTEDSIRILDTGRGIELTHRTAG